MNRDLSASSKLDIMVRLTRKQVEIAWKLVLVPILIVASVISVALYLFGGFDLLRYSFVQMFTPAGARKVMAVVAGLTLVTTIRYLAWHPGETSPKWFRNHLWVNILEAVVLAIVAASGIWALYQFGAPAIVR